MTDNPDTTETPTIDDALDPSTWSVTEPGTEATEDDAAAADRPAAVQDGPARTLSLTDMGDLLAARQGGVKIGARVLTFTQNDRTSLAALIEDHRHGPTGPRTSAYELAELVMLDWAPRVLGRDYTVLMYDDGSVRTSYEVRTDGRPSTLRPAVSSGNRDIGAVDVRAIEIVYGDVLIRNGWRPPLRRAGRPDDEQPESAARWWRCDDVRGFNDQVVISLPRRLGTGMLLQVTTGIADPRTETLHLVPDDSGSFYCQPPGTGAVEIHTVRPPSVGVWRPVQ